nr:Smr/MutS family protein [uncultured Desulfuromonas sp.]
MAKKNKNEKNAFKNNPFKSVKGFCVSEPEVKPKKVVKAEVPSPADESDVDFATAMERLGVENIESQDGLVERPFDDVFSDEEDASLPPAAEVDDESLFLASLGAVDKVFSDDIPDDDETPRAEPRRMKQLRQGKIRPQDRLDLHGCYRDEARDKVRLFLKHRFEQGLQTVLIITGRGKRSPGGESVVRQEIERYLSTQAQAWVAEWGRAPRQYGGDGALVVFLRQK